MLQYCFLSQFSVILSSFKTYLPSSTVQHISRLHWNQSPFKMNSFTALPETSTYLHSSLIYPCLLPSNHSEDCIPPQVITIYCLKGLVVLSFISLPLPLYWLIPTSMSKSLWKLLPISPLWKLTFFEHQVLLLVTGLCLWSHYSQIFKRAVCKDCFLVFWGNLSLQSPPRALYLWASSEQSFLKSPVRDGWRDGCRDKVLHSCAAWNAGWLIGLRKRLSVCLNNLKKWKSWLKTQHSENLRSWHLVPSLHGN